MDDSLHNNYFNFIKKIVKNLLRIFLHLRLLIILDAPDINVRSIQLSFCIHFKKSFHLPIVLQFCSCEKDALDLQLIIYYNCISGRITKKEIDKAIRKKVAEDNIPLK